MTRRFLILLVVALTAAFFLLMPACGSSPTDPSGDDPGDGPGDDPGDDPPDDEWPEGLVGLRDGMDALSDSATTRYHELRLSMDASAARGALLAELDDWDDIQEAKLLSDGSSVQLVFSDTTRCVLVTDEHYFGGRSSEARHLDVTPVNPSTLDREVDRILGDRLECGDIRVPDNHKVSIVNMAGGIREGTHDLVDLLVQRLLYRGWDIDDIDIKQRESFDDFSFTPDTMFDQSGYGMVFMMGLGGFTEAADGSEYFALECFRGGQYDERWEPYVTEERWSDYQEWYYEDGTLLTKKGVHDDGEGWSEIYVREDLLAEEMILDEGAMVHVLSNSGIEAAEELMEAGAGCVTGWTGPTNLEVGADAFMHHLDMMIGEDGEPLSAFDAVLAMDYLDLQEFDGEYSLFTANSSYYDFMLPAQMSFDAPFDCLEEGTVYYDVNINYPDCPENNQSFQFFPGGEFELTGLPPVGAEIEFTARDAEGGILGRGDLGMELKGGPNEVELCPCEGFFVAIVFDSDLPPGCDELGAVITYDDPEIDSVTKLVPVDNPRFGDLIPGMASVDFHAFGPEGIYGSSTMNVDITCDGTVPTPCFGWFHFRVIEAPPSVTEITVETVYDTNFPNPLQFGPSDEADMFGFWVGDDVTLYASARDGDGRIMGVQNVEATVGCGAQEVLLEFDPYGIILEAVPDSVAAREGQFAELTATVRFFTDFDTTEPTGDPLPYKTVYFESSFGEFEDGVFFGTTDEEGKLSVRLSSLEPGTAEVLATCDGGQVTSLPINVEFLEILSVFFDNRSSHFTGDWGNDCSSWCWLEYHCLERELLCEDERISGDEGGPYRWIAHRKTHPVVGETLYYTFTPKGDCIHDLMDPPYDAPLLGQFYIHWYYGTDYGNQITLKVTDRMEYLSEPVTFAITLTDPISGEPPEVRQVVRDGTIPTFSEHFHPSDDAIIYEAQ